MHKSRLTCSFQSLLGVALLVPPVVSWPTIDTSNMVVNNQIIPIPLATERTIIKPLTPYNPDPPCIVWKTRKNQLSSFIQKTEKPYEELWEQILKANKNYQKIHGQPMPLNPKNWSKDYRTIFYNLDTLATQRNFALQRLRTIRSVEGQAALAETITNGTIQHHYCDRGYKL